MQRFALLFVRPRSSLTAAVVGLGLLALSACDSGSTESPDPPAEGPADAAFDSGGDGTAGDDSGVPDSEVPDSGAADAGGDEDASDDAADTEDASAPDAPVADAGTDADGSSTPDTGEDGGGDAGLDVAPDEGDTDPPVVEARETITDEGGDVEAGGATLEIPGGALAEAVEISVEPRVEERPGFDVASPVFAFGPAGTTFQRPVRVEIPVERAPEGLVVFWSTPDGSDYEPVTTEVRDGVLYGFVTHFSEGFAGEDASDACADVECGRRQPPACDGETLVVFGQPSCREGECRAPSERFTCDDIPFATGTCVAEAGAGACVIAECEPGYEDCDGEYFNGCEAFIGSDEHCLGCGLACGDGSYCDGGVCVEEAECAEAADCPDSTAAPVCRGRNRIVRFEPGCSDDGECTTVEVIEPCGPGNECVAGACQPLPPQCAEDADCAQPAFCDDGEVVTPQAFCDEFQQCVPDGETREACSEPSVCAAGACTDPGFECAVDDDCRAGADVCDGDVAVRDASRCEGGFCVAATTVVDCGAIDRDCDAGYCVAECDSDEACTELAAPFCARQVAVVPVAMACDNGDCEAASFEETDCAAAGELCVQGACVPPPPECTSDAECAVDVPAVCAGPRAVRATFGVCTDAGDCATSFTDTPCPSGDVCEAGACVPAPPECVADEDCDGDQVCEGGDCVPAPPECEPACEDDFVCRPEGCMPVCAADADCGPFPLTFCDGDVLVTVEDGACVEGACSILAETRSPCADGTACFDGACVDPDTGCTSDGECGDGEFCDADGACRPRGPATCEVDTDCAEGDVCEDGFCRGPAPTCASDADCPSFSFCIGGDVATPVHVCTDDGVCEFVDETVTPCPDGTACFDGACVEPGDECVTHEDCGGAPPACDGDVLVGDGRVCEAGFCVDHGAWAYDCASEGATCNPDGFCQHDGPPPCASDDECAAGDVCIDGFCQWPGEPCADDGTCPEGHVCDPDGFCKPDGGGFLPCADDGTCPEGHFCDPEGFCHPDGGGFPTCESSEECSPDEQCVDGFCHWFGPACDVDEDCPTEEACVDGHCQWQPPTCDTPEDCASVPFCTPDGVVFPVHECSPDGFCEYVAEEFVPCEGDTVCFDGACVPPGDECVTPEDCGGGPPTCEGDVLVGGGQGCEAGYCVDYGSWEYDCASEGGFCERDHCVPACTVDEECIEFSHPTCDGDAVAFPIAAVCGDDGRCEVTEVEVSPCPDGEVCEYGACRPGPCDTDDDCGERQFCNADGYCQFDGPAPCAADDDCAPGDVCFEGFCHPDGGGFQPCADDGTCPEGHFCDPDGFCKPNGGGFPPCESSEECSPDEQCVDGFCHWFGPACDVDEDCPTEEACVDGHCQWRPPTCDTPEDCASVPFCTPDGVVFPVHECSPDGFCEYVAEEFVPCEGDTVCFDGACVAPGDECVTPEDCGGGPPTCEGDVLVGGGQGCEAGYCVDYGSWEYDCASEGATCNPDGFCEHTGGGVCISDEDCPTGDVCVDGFCQWPGEPCADDGTCPEGHFCDPEGFCKPDGGGFPPCADDGTCPEGAFCDADGFCKPDGGGFPPCADDGTCPEGAFCDADGFCHPDGGGFPGCDTDDECAPEEACFDGVCQWAGFPCETEAECAAGEACVDGRCAWQPTEDECIIPEDCGGGPPTCEGDVLVGSGWVCEAGACVDYGPWEYDCASEGATCNPAGFCEHADRGQPCVVDEDCPTGDICMAGFCEPAF